LVSGRFDPDPEVVRRVAAALHDVPTSAYSVPHVYPAAAPAYMSAPKVDRPYPDSDGPFTLYVHLPYCRYRCTFCHFAVRVGARDSTMERYVQAVERELDWIRPGTVLAQLYVGGGTPTVVPPELLDRLLRTVFDRTTPAGEHVHTVETSPETISEAHLDVLRVHGVRRVSMGVQSLETTVLDQVHRDQTPGGALAACRMLLESGLIVNVDLIYGLPGQSPESFLLDLETLADLGVPSLTLYSLRVTERTPVARVLGDAAFDLAGLMRWRAFVQDAAEGLGYTQTRWHTFKRLESNARAHERLQSFDRKLIGCQLGVGMSARSNLGDTLYRNHEVHDEYLRRVERGESPVEQIFVFAEEDRMTQFVARSLGDGKPLRRDDYVRVFGREVDADFGPLLERLTDAHLVDDLGEALVLSDLGTLLYDVVTLAFYPPRAHEWLAARQRGSTPVSVTTSS
jgi:oxygen-independent coproporphyrinogen-3 oxidase